MIDLVDGVCPYTPPRVLDNYKFEKRINYQQYVENLLPIPIEKHAETLIYQEYSINMQQIRPQYGSTPLPSSKYKNKHPQYLHKREIKGANSSQVCNSQVRELC
jgi:hypothetical protein